MKKLSYLILLLISAVSFSQNIRFDGVIFDSNNTPLEMANVMDSYAITNDKGKFILNLKPNTKYSIKISYLGMKNKEIAIATTNQNLAQNIVMNSGEVELEGVEIVREMP